MTRAIIFDLYFTLVSFELEELDALLVPARAMLSLEPDVFAQHFLPAYVRYECGEPDSFEEFLELLAQGCGVSCSAADVAQCAASWRDFQRRSLWMPQETVDALASLRARGLKLGLISNTMAEVPPLWNASVAAPLFDAAVFSCEFGLRKPAPEIYLHACELLQVQPTECVFVGDGGSNELSGAERVGMRAVQLRGSAETLQRDARLGREAWTGPSVASLDELPTALALERH